MYLITKRVLVENYVSKKLIFLGYKYARLFKTLYLSVKPRNYWVFSQNGSNVNLAYGTIGYFVSACKYWVGRQSTLSNNTTLIMSLLCLINQRY